MDARFPHVIGLVCLLAAALAQPAGAQDAAGTTVALTPPVSAPAPPDAYPWRGRETAIEAFLRTAVITHVTDIPVGITRPRRAFFVPGGPAASMAWKPLHDQVLHGKQESYRSEIAAYLLSRHLGLDMVPPVVEREIDGVKGAAVYWIEGVRPWDPAAPPRFPGANWARQTSRMFMFDQLIANIDRNQGNLLYDASAHVFLIDHSRAFTPKTDLSGLASPQQFDRALWERMAALTRADLDTVLGQSLGRAQIEAVLRRRDEMRRHIARQVRERGEAVTFLPPARESAGGASD